MTIYKGVVGVFLFVCFTAALLLSVVIISARLFQADIATISHGLQRPVTFSDVEAAAARYDRLQTQDARSMVSMDETAAQIDEREQERRAAREAAISALRETATLSGESFGEIGPEQDLRQHLSRWDRASHANEAAFSQARASALAAIDLEQRLSASIADLRGRQALLADQQARIDGALTQVVEPFGTNWTTLHPRYRYLSSESPLGLGWRVATMDPVFLSIVLVVFMSGFGAMLYLLPAYLNRPEPVTISEVITRIVAGTSTGVFTFLVLNALVLLSLFVTGTQTPLNLLNINPYAVAIVGFMSGIMTEDFFKWLQDRGRGLLIR